MVTLTAKQRETRIDVPFATMRDHLQAFTAKAGGTTTHAATFNDRPGTLTFTWPSRVVIDPENVKAVIAAETRVRVAPDVLVARRCHLTVEISTDVSGADPSMQAKAEALQTELALEFGSLQGFGGTSRGYEGLGA